jgi:hypothetical protein
MVEGTYCSYLHDAEADPSGTETADVHIAIASQVDIWIMQPGEETCACNVAMPVRDTRLVHVVLSTAHRKLSWLLERATVVPKTRPLQASAIVGVLDLVVRVSARLDKRSKHPCLGNLISNKNICELRPALYNISAQATWLRCVSH